MANESDNAVWFDNLQIRPQEGLIVQENHYYPFGMEMVGLGKKGSPNHGFDFMGVETTKSFGLNWSMTDFRGYDKQLGRFHGVDALAEKYGSITPYQFAFNNPVLFNDPTGLDPVYDWDDGKYYDEGKEASWENVQKYIAGTIDNALVGVFYTSDFSNNFNLGRLYNTTKEPHTQGNWYIQYGIDLNDARKGFENFMESRDNKPLNNFVLYAHGSATNPGLLSLSDEFNGLSGKWLKYHQDYGIGGEKVIHDALNTLQYMIDSVKDGGNCVIGACFGARDWDKEGSNGRELVESVLLFTRKRVNLFMNADYTTLSHIHNRKLTPFGILSKPGMNKQGWVQVKHGNDVSKGIKRTNVEISSTGLVIPY